MNAHSSITHGTLTIICLEYNYGPSHFKGPILRHTLTATVVLHSRDHEGLHFLFKLIFLNIIWLNAMMLITLLPKIDAAIIPNWPPLKMMFKPLFSKSIRAPLKCGCHLGLHQLCRHNFEHNKLAKASSIMPA